MLVAGPGRPSSHEVVNIAAVSGQRAINAAMPFIRRHAPAIKLLSYILYEASYFHASGYRYFRFLMSAATMQFAYCISPFSLVRRRCASAADAVEVDHFDAVSKRGVRCGV